MKLSDNWKKLSLVCEKPEYGYTTSASDQKQGPKFLRTTDITAGSINWDNVPFCNAPPTDEKKYLLRDGDILISRAGSIGASVVIQSPPRAVFASYLIRFRPKNIINPLFGGFFLKSNFFWNQLKSKSSGTTLSGVNASNLSEILIPVPSLSVQKKVVSVLKECQFAIEKRRQTIRLADEFLKSAFLEMFGDPNKNPKKWPIKTLDEVSVLKGQYGSGASAVEYESDKPRYIRITDIDENGNLRDKKVSPSTEESEWEDYILTDGDILFARSGATVGKTYRFREQDGFCIFAGYLIRYKLDSKKLHPDYLYFFTKTNFYKKWVLSKMKTVAQPNINAQQYGSEFKLPIPLLSTQQKFADIVQKVERLKEKQRQSEAELQNLFNSLMQRAFRGEI